jgi:hypothetical protein
MKKVVVMVFMFCFLFVYKIWKTHVYLLFLLVFEERANTKTEKGGKEAILRLSVWHICVFFDHLDAISSLYLQPKRFLWKDYMDRVVAQKVRP